MTRFSDDSDWDFGRYMLWENAQGRALSSPRGQHALALLEEALLALPRKRLIDSALVKDGEVCAVGAYVVAQRIAAGEDRAAVLAQLEGTASNEEYGGDVTARFGNQAGMSYAMAWRLAELNDEDFRNDSPEQRYVHVLAWVRRAQGKDAVAA